MFLSLFPFATAYLKELQIYEIAWVPGLVSQGNLDEIASVIAFHKCVGGEFGENDGMPCLSFRGEHLQPYELYFFPDTSVFQRDLQFQFPTMEAWSQYPTFEGVVAMFEVHLKIFKNEGSSEPFRIVYLRFGYFPFPRDCIMLMWLGAADSF